jgi:hypothetical protein
MPDRWKSTKPRTEINYRRVVGETTDQDLQALDWALARGTKYFVLEFSAQPRRRSIRRHASSTPLCRDEGIVGQTIDTPTLVSHCLLANFPCESRRDGLKRASGRGRPPVRNGNASRYFANTSRCHQGIACLAGHVPNSNHLDPLPATAASPRSLALPPRLACFLQRVVN